MYNKKYIMKITDLLDFRDFGNVKSFNKALVWGVIIFFFLLFTCQVTLGQDTVRVVHSNYTSVFSKSKKYPVLVEWWLTSKKVNCQTPLKRKDNFQPDPKLKTETDIAKYYVGSGYDRGHMMPAADNLCQTQLEQNECFYFSNMAPQHHVLNAGDWKSLEMWSREIAKSHDSIHIWAGNIGEVKKIGLVSVPEICWKLIYIKKTKQWLGYVFYNKQEKQVGIKAREVSKSAIEKLTGFKF
jgi:endonuclease G